MPKAKPAKAKEVPLSEFVPIWRGKCVISRIGIEVDLQIRRGGVDMDVVKEYSTAIQDDMDDLPPVAVFTEVGRYNEKCALTLSDGFHRVETYKVMKRQTIPVMVFQGDKTDAFIYSVKCNGEHGQPLTRKDREKAVRRMLSDEKTKNWSVRKIAEIVHCSKSTVQNIKNPPAPSPSKAKSTTPEEKHQKKAATASPAVNGEARSAADAVHFDTRGNFRNGEAPAVTPLAVHERQPPALTTSEERLRILRDWVKEGHVEKSDVMNIFASESGRMVWIPRSTSQAAKTLIIRCDGEVLIETEVLVNAELPAVIDVGVRDPALVEYSRPKATLPGMVPAYETAEPTDDPFAQE